MNTLAEFVVNDDGLVLDPTTGHRFQVSPTGLIILRGLIEHHTDAEIVEQLALDCDVTIENALRDLSDFREHIKTRPAV
jgi:hypothetical protein